jgi:hypothetical protein
VHGSFQTSHTRVGVFTAPGCMHYLSHSLTPLPD